MALGTDHLNTATSANFIPEVWSGKVILARESRLVLKPLITEYSGFSGGDEGFGDVIHIPNVSNLVANDKVTEVEVVLQSPSEGDNFITVNKHKESSYLIEDRLRKVAMGTYLGYYAEKAGFAVAKACDTDVAAEWVNAGDFVGDNATAITRENIILGMFKLDEVDAPKEGRSLVIAPDGFSDILNIDEFTLWTNTGESPATVINGLRGEVFGLPLYVSTNIAVEAGTPNTVHNLLMQEEAIGYVMPQPPRTQNDYMLEFLGWLFVVDSIYGIKTLRADHLIDFRSLEIV